MRILLTIATVALLCGAVPAVQSQHTAVASADLKVSPELLELLRAEMRELLIASQAISMALPTGDWAQIRTTSERIQKSYILEKQLTEAQRTELGSLPEGFRTLDEQFHRRAEKLAHAASEKDAELAAFQFARLLEDCAGCHAAYAKQRFPGLAGPTADSHHQH